MGYSPPKKQLDLKDFLSTPAKKRSGGFGFRRTTAKAAPTRPEADTEADTGTETQATTDKTS